MKQADLKALDLPDSPGVYFFRDNDGQVMYVGKATSLRSRVRSYFAADLISTRGPRIVDMVTRAATVTFEATDSVLDALLLEAYAIKEYHPPANVDGKDDKSFSYVVITKEAYPRLLVVRGRELEIRTPKSLRKRTYGPFPHTGQLREALRIIRKIFPFFDTKHPIDHPTDSERHKIVFNQQIGLYPDITDEEARAKYAETIRHISMLFEGKKKLLLKELERSMHAAAAAQEFERANVLKRQLFALQHIRDVSLIKAEMFGSARPIRIEAYDIAHLSGANMVGVMTVIENGEPLPSAYRKFTIRTVSSSNDTAALTEVLERRLGHAEWLMPSLIVVDGGRAQKSAAERTLAKYGVRIPVVSVVKDERHRPRDILGAQTHRSRYEREILLANAESHRFALAFHRNKRSRGVKDA